MGGLKSSDELIDTYMDLIAKYPRIAMIIEPFSKNVKIFKTHQNFRANFLNPFLIKEPLAWYKLYSRVSKHCLIANTLKVNDLNETKQHDDNDDEEIKKIENLNSEGKQDSNKIPDQSKILESIKPTSTIIMPVNFLKYENSANVTSFISKIRENDEKKLYHGVSCSLNETEDSFLSDLVRFNSGSDSFEM